MDQLTQRYGEKILTIAARYGAEDVRVFGSRARGDSRPDSDLDLLVRWEGSHSLLDVIGLQQDIEEAIGCKVDLVTESSLHPLLKERCLNEAVHLFESGQHSTMTKRPEKDPFLLHNMIDAAKHIEEYAKIGPERFLAEEHWQDAIIRRLEIIGETASHLSKELKAKHPEVEWEKFAEIRNRLIHEYFRVDLNELWNNALEIAEMRQQFERILAGQ